MSRRCRDCGRRRWPLGAYMTCRPCRRRQDVVERSEQQRWAS